MKHTRLWIALLAGVATLSLAGDIGAAETATVRPRRLNVRSAPSLRSEVVTVLERGEELEVIESSGAWIEIRIPATDETGFVYRSLVDIAPAEAEQPPPVREPAPEPVKTVAPAPRPAPVRAPAPRREPAQPVRAPAPERTTRFVIFVNGTNTAAISGSMSSSYSLYDETESVSESYDFGSGTGFEIGAAARLVGPFGLHVAYAQASPRSGSAAITAQFPHPFYYLQPRTLSTTVDGLEQTESAVHLDLAVLAGKSERLHFVAFAGLSLFSAKIDLVKAPELRETYPFDEVLVTFPKETLDDGPMGFNAGASVDFYFTRNLGIGAQVRYSQGKASFDQGEKGALDVDLGGAQAAVGLRMAF